MKRKVPNPAQDAFEWPETEPVVDNVDKCGQVLTLDAEGHRWVASMFWGSQEEFIKHASWLKAHGYADTHWIVQECLSGMIFAKQQAALHEAKALQMEGL